MENAAVDAGALGFGAAEERPEEVGAGEIAGGAAFRADLRGPAGNVGVQNPGGNGPALGTAPEGPDVALAKAIVVDEADERPGGQKFAVAIIAARIEE